MTDDDPVVEELSANQPPEYPPRSWHDGPADSEMVATGIAYFRVGKGGVTSIVRSKRTGDVYVHRDGLVSVGS